MDSEDIEISPNFERLRTALLCGEPDRVPLAELKVEDEIKSGFLGRPIPDPKPDPEGYIRSEIEFATRAGYDYIRVGVISPLPFPGHPMEERYGLDGSIRKRTWAEQKSGLITNEEELERFRFPRPEEFDFTLLEVASRLVPPQMKILTAIKGGGIYERTWMMMGFESFCLNLIERPALVEELFRRIGELYLEVYTRAAEFPNVAGFWIGDDLAYTEGLMLSPDVFRRNLFPFYEAVGDMCRQKEMVFIFHSDGRLWEVLEDLIAIGINALHPIEPKAMDIVEVKERTRGRLCLIGNIDLGYTLTRGTPADVEEEVRERIKALAPGGGYCVSSSNSVTEYVPLENYNAMRLATLRYGGYPISLD